MVHIVPQDKNINTFQYSFFEIVIFLQPIKKGISSFAISDLGNLKDYLRFFFPWLH